MPRAHGTVYGFKRAVLTAVILLYRTPWRHTLHSEQCSTLVQVECNVSYIPKEIGELPQLQLLNLSDNPWLHNKCSSLEYAPLYKVLKYCLSARHTARDKLRLHMEHDIAHASVFTAG